MSRETPFAPQNWKEVDGEIEPAFVGVNRPHYPSEADRDTIMPHDMYSEPAGTTDGAEEYVPVDRREWRDNVPTDEEKEIGKAGLDGALRALEEATKKQE